MQPEERASRFTIQEIVHTSCPSTRDPSCDVVHVMSGRQSEHTHDDVRCEMSRNAVRATRCSTADVPSRPATAGCAAQMVSMCEFIGTKAYIPSRMAGEPQSPRSRFGRNERHELARSGCGVSGRSRETRLECRDAIDVIDPSSECGIRPRGAWRHGEASNGASRPFFDSNGPGRVDVLMTLVPVSPRTTSERVSLAADDARTPDPKSTGGPRVS